MVARVNGVERSRGNFRDIYYTFAQMIARASRDATLYPGDVLGSGTVGVDINADAIALARLNVEENGLCGSIELHCQNVLQSVVDEQLIKSFRDVDVVTCFMMLHDLFNIAGLKDILFDQLRAAFPNVKYFIIADTVRMPAPDTLSELPIFSVGFELLHAFMGIQIHEKSAYDEAFVKAGLKIETCIEFGAPSTYLYCLRV